MNTINPSNFDQNKIIDLYANGKFTDAINVIKSFQEIYPSSEILFNFLGAIYLEIKEIKLALKNLKKAVQLNRNYIEAYNNLGLVYFRLNDLENAKFFFLKTINLNKNYLEGYNNLGLTSLEEKEYENAISYFNLAIKMKNNYFESWINLGNTYLKLEKFCYALKSFEKAKLINENSSDLYSSLGNLCKCQGNLNKAIEFYKKAISISPNDTKLYCNIGVLLKDNNKTSEAISYFVKGLNYDPLDCNILNNLGDTYKSCNQFSKAIQCFEKALKINPHLTEANMNLSYCRLKTVPEWHIEMLNDKERNKVYYEALKKVIGKNDTVLDIGTGSGILSMIATKFTNNKVYTCENSDIIADVAKQIISTNGLSSRIEVISKKSTDIKIKENLPKKVDVLISEILAAEFVGEGVRETIKDAKNRLLKEDGLMIPQAGEIKFALINDAKNIRYKTFVDYVYGFDISKFNNITTKKLPFHFNKKPKFLSKPNVAFKINLDNERILEKKDRLVEIPITENGVCLGIVQWLKVKIFDDIYYENLPGLVRSHWPTPIFIFNQPVKVSKGENLKIKITLLKDNIWFSNIS